MTKVVLLDEASGRKATVNIEDLPPFIQKAVEKVQEAAEGGGLRGHKLTQSEIETSLMVAATERIERYRAGDYDPADPFDHSGAAAIACQLHALLKRQPEGHITDIEGRIVATACEAESAIRGAAEKGGATLPDDAEMGRIIRPPAERICFAMQSHAAWAHSGFLTFDVARGLYDLVLRTAEDPGACAAPADTLFDPPGSAFAIRLPGPDYPVIDDGHGDPYEVRGLIVSQFTDAGSDDVLEMAREAMQAGADALEPDENGKAYFRSMVDAVASAGKAATTKTGVSTIIHFAGWYPTQRRAVGTALENAYLIVRPGPDETPTIGDVLRVSADNAAQRAGCDPTPFRALAAVAFGVALWLIHSDDTAHPVRSRPVKVFGTKERVQPQTFSIGRGVKNLTGGNTNG